MDPLILPAVVVGASAAIALGNWWFSPDRRARSAMRRVPARRIADVKDGETVRIVGRVQPGDTMEAPLSSRACVCFRVVVQERTGARNRVWVTIVDEERGLDFIVRDESGKALVKAESDLVQAVLQDDDEFSSGVLHPAPPKLEAFLVAHGRSSRGGFLKSVQYREGALEVGERVCIVGVGRWERDPDETEALGGSYRDVELPQRLVVRSPERDTLLISDEPRLIRAASKRSPKG